MKIKAKRNYGATGKKGEHWLAEGETYDTQEIGMTDERALALIGIGVVQHLGEVDELWGKNEKPVAQPSKNAARKVTPRARQTKRTTNTK